MTCGDCDHYATEHPTGGRCTHRERLDGGGWDYCGCQQLTPDGGDR